MRSWRDMSEFAGVDLEDTAILGWHRDGEALTFEVEVSLWPEHPQYAPPRPGEHTCYRRGRLRFAGVSVEGDLPGQSEVESYRDPDGSEDYGTFDALTLEGNAYRVVTDFTDVTVRGGSISLEVLE